MYFYLIAIAFITRTYSLNSSTMNLTFLSSTQKSRVQVLEDVTIPLRAARRNDCEQSPTCDTSLRKNHHNDTDTENSYRLAVLICGLIRTWPLVQRSFVHHVIEPNPPGSVDVVFAVAYEEANECHQVAVNNMTNIKGARVLLYDYPRRVKDSTHNKVYFAIRRALELLQNPSRYALILRTRADFWFAVPIVTRDIMRTFGSTDAARASSGKFLLYPCTHGGNFTACPGT